MLPFNKHHRERLQSLLVGLSLLLIGLFLFANAYKSSINIYKTPSELITLNSSIPSVIRLGGIVSKNSLIRDSYGVIHFTIEDDFHKIPVVFKGIPPNLFKEDQAAIAIGFFQDSVFHAHEILAKHDENYVIPLKRVSNVS